MNSSPDGHPPATLLFLCSGNYYRSRFAEILFNHLAELTPLPWQADSRGLALTPANVGPISLHTLERLEQLRIVADRVATLRFPQEASVTDFAAAGHIVALKESEHRPLMERDFPEWAERVEYWTVHDIDCATPQDALPTLERMVRELFTRLQRTYR